MCGVDAGIIRLVLLVFLKDFSQLFQNPRDYGRIDIFRLNMSEQKRIGHDNGRIKKRSLKARAIAGISMSSSIYRLLWSPDEPGLK